ncbi:transposase [Streptomyces sp. NPDC002677]|uniref:transposase n=1 Tax=Streptomyces sp. NPDC002677 TaxID=3154774 RepID=UPI00331C8063
MSADLSKRLVPDELWELVLPLLPSFAARPQGGGTAPRDERAVFTAVGYVLTSGSQDLAEQLWSGVTDVTI